MVVVNEQRTMYGVFLILCVIGTQGKPSMSFNLPSFPVFGGFSGGREQRQATLKEYSGRRMQNDSTRMVYFHDQTVAVVELGPKKLLLNCELIEINEPEEIQRALGNLTDVARPVYISLREMLTLMSQCQLVEAQTMDDETTTLAVDVSKRQSGPVNRGLLSNNPLTLLSGIIPGTKWCGTGDIATDYFDLGAEPNVDKCCRAHDLCPVKVRGYSQKYNLTNNSLYTKSLCQCDDALYDCLKSKSSPTAAIMGNIYFNIIQVPCVHNMEDGKKFRKAKSNF